MESSISVGQLLRSLGPRLQLERMTGAIEDDSMIGSGGAEGGHCLIGHINPIHPCAIQIVDAEGFRHLDGLKPNSRHDSLRVLFADPVRMVIVADGLEVPDDFVRRATGSGVILVATPQPANDLLAHIQYFLSRELAQRATMHGVFMEVLSIGVLIAGMHGAGKSELALELITRGHRLVADDVTEFALTNPETVIGSCPELLQDFMEVRGLGVINIREMFGDSAIRRSKSLGLIVSLLAMDERRMTSVDRLRGTYCSRLLLGQQIPEVTLPVAAGRNLAVLVESAVRNHILLQNGYDAASDFIDRQHRALARESL